MADNIPITAGTGTTIATDDVAAVHYQRVKLVDGTLDSTAAIPGDATNGLYVNVKAAVAVPVTDNAGSLTVDNSGTFVVQATLSAETVKVIGTVNVAASQTIDATNAGTFAVQDSQVIADGSAFTPATSKVFPIGYTLDDTSTDLVGEGDIGAARMTGDRRVIVQIGESGAKDVVGGGTQTGTSSQAIMAAVASTYNYLQWVTVYNSSATNTYCTILDGATARAVLPLPAYGGAIFQPTRPLRSTVNTAWNVAAGAGVTTAYFYGGGYTATA